MGLLLYRGLSDIYQAEIDKIAKDSQELMYRREKNSLMNRKGYFRAQQIWRDFIGGVLSGAAAGTGVGAMTRFGSSGYKPVRGFR